MTNIEQKALELVNEVLRENNPDLLFHTGYSRSEHCYTEALCRAIERHEAFRQEVSDAVVDYVGYVPLDSPAHPITRFIITKPDPLVEAIRECWHSDKILEDRFRAALAKRGLEIREKEA